jgi:hypothetical protein
MKIFAIILSLFIVLHLQAQELYPSTEPASAMSSKSIGIRLNNELFPAYDYQAGNVKMHNNLMFRLNPELMWGINKKWMMHVNMYASNAHESNLKFEGVGLYLKFRFLSFDQVQSHFRIAVYGKAALIDNPIQYNDINLAGDNSGVGGGIIATQLLHKVALSFTGGYLRSMNNLGNRVASSSVKDAINYSFSAGYLLFPFQYKDYKQPNLNLYVEFLGKSNPDTNENYLDMAPALQLILNSIIRIDLVYQKQLYGNMLRINDQAVLLRFEYNFFNVYK